MRLKPEKYLRGTVKKVLIKKTDVMSFSGKRMEFETILLTEINQTQKVKSGIFSLTCGSQRSGVTHENQRRSVEERDQGGGRKGNKERGEIQE